MGSIELCNRALNNEPVYLQRSGLRNSNARHHCICLRLVHRDEQRHCWCIAGGEGRRLHAALPAKLTRSFINSSNGCSPGLAVLDAIRRDCRSVRFCVGERVVNIAHGDVCADVGSCAKREWVRDFALGFGRGSRTRCEWLIRCERPGKSMLGLYLARAFRLGCSSLPVARPLPSLTGTRKIGR